MKVRSEEFKNKVNAYGRELSSIISYNDNILDDDDINKVNPYFNATILKSVMKNLIIDVNSPLPINTIINLKIGVKVSNEYEYLNYGNYIVQKSDYNADTNSFSCLCYDKMLYSMKEYMNLQNGTFPMTIREYLTNLCLDIGMIFKNTNDVFANYDKVIESDLYANLGYTYRDIFDELSQVTASTICIDENDLVEVRYIVDTNDTINEDFFPDVNVSFGEKYGPVNSIVLSRSAESDNIYLQDEESVNLNGLCEIKIIDNLIMNNNDRNEYLPAILEKLNGLEYYTNDFTSTGILYYELCDRYKVQIGENTYDCVLFNDEVKISQGLTEDIYTEKPKESVTDYTKSDKTDKKINQAYLMVDKQNQTIEGLTSKVYGIQIENENSYQEILEKFDGYTPKNQTLELENSVKTLQTDTYTKTEINTKLTDGSVTMVQTTSGTFDEDGLTIEKTNAKTKGNFNEKGVLVMDATGNQEEELLFAGYDEDLGSTIVRSKNIRVEKYLNIGTHSRIEDYEDGTGIFFVG
ncbi:MAG: hypothetical protein IJZ77_06305 [Bacilli bacterium]|nr:hypothetical protein [Bacilli bacterium]MBQ8473192.1 hypothetical protein [Bacilli bacterium]